MTDASLPHQPLRESRGVYSEPVPAPARARVDACPGVFAPHDAADGALARVRLPGGVLTSAQLEVLAGCAVELGDGAVHLTSRGNIQLRGLDRADPDLGRRLSAAELLPAPDHERVRNILASPLSGVAGGLADVRGLAAELDRQLCARPALAGLPGRFLFALDDGRGDVAGESADLCWRAGDRSTGTLLVAGSGTGLRVPLGAAVDVLLRAAEVFLALRAAEGGTAWRVHELPAAAGRIAAVLGGNHRFGGESRDVRDARCPNDDHHAGAGDASPSVPAPLVGPVPRSDGGTAVGAAPLLGELSAAQLRRLAQLAPAALVTPWRTVLLPEPVGNPADALARLAGAGLLVDPHDPALRVSACVGRPGCATALADVRADACALIEAAGGLEHGRRVHVAGCARRCGAPRGVHTDVVAVEGGGYQVDGTWLPALRDRP